MMNGLTKHQEEKFDEVVELVSSKERRILLMGNAGVGKTWLLNVIVDHFTKDTYPNKILCSAPTHKALRVIRDKVSVKGIKFSTIHSALHYKGITDRYTGEKVFVSVPNMDYPPLKGIKYWIIDESSMLPTKLYTNLIEASKEYKVKVLFVGDAYQLAPVNEKISKVFTSTKVTRLDTIVRQKDTNPALKLITMAREDVKNGTNNFINFLIANKDNDLVEITNNEGFKIYRDKALFRDTCASSFNRDIDIKYMAWTNDNVSSWNRAIKDVVNPSQAFVDVGDVVVGYNTIHNNDVNVHLENSLTYRIEKLEHKQAILPGVNFMYYSTVLISEYGDYSYVNIVDINHYTAFKEVYLEFLIAARTRSNWPAFYNFKNNYLLFTDVKDAGGTVVIKKDLDLGYGTTVHKSQGSTYSNVGIYLPSFRTCYNNFTRRSLLYVASSRTNKTIYVYDN